MASVLYVFPHPDDESFGPAPAMARQEREGHDVHLLTLTRGEATTQRERLGLSREEMGETRRAEMQGVARVLSLASLSVLDFPDGGLADLDPRVVEGAIAAHVRGCRPDVLVTYAAHGVSGHRDHLVSHAAAKRVFCELRGEESAGYLRRLALFTLPEESAGDRPDHLAASPETLIDARVRFSGEDHARAEEALAAYETYRPVIEEHKPLKSVAGGVCFELFQERFAPPLDDLFGRLPE
ncbi:MAG: PIG-L family deacetylase [Bacteroidetes bacterium QS_9_68_14]|nr:MAG: PIG-L family deacetylase [Bacteroidetes bacterium QS_9_68_14]